MLEMELTQYGVFGLWTISNLLMIKWFLIKTDKREEELQRIIKNNTEVISKFMIRIENLKKNDFK